MDPAKKTTSSHFFAFATYPSASFESLAPGETIILLLRAHPITQLGWFLNTLGLIVLLIVLNLFITFLFNPAQMLFINIFGIAFIFAYALFNFFVWYFNVGIVTNMRVIDVDTHSLTYKEVSEARINKVEDVTSKSGGFFASIFDYGNVFVQTAGAEVNIEFLNVPKPAEVVRIINELLPV